MSRIETLRAILSQSIQSNLIITKCWEPDCQRHRIGNTWFVGNSSGYNRVSHGICPTHAKALEQELDALTIN